MRYHNVNKQKLTVTQLSRRIPNKKLTVTQLSRRILFLQDICRWFVHDAFSAKNIYNNNILLEKQCFDIYSMGSYHENMPCFTL